MGVHKKNGDAVFSFWDRINDILCLSSDKNMKKLHSLRLSFASVRQPGCWVYRLWCLKDGRCYM